jgi:uncharacterized protein YndB with AHSA1/START domain
MPVAEKRNEGSTRPRAWVQRVSDTELVWTRSLQAGASVVFDAFTKPEFVKRWWAPRSRGLEMVQCEADVRVGGAYVYALARGGKVVVTFTGRYLEIVPPHRVVYTAAMAPFPDEIMATVTFTEKDGFTELVSREVYPSKKALDDAIASGMESGALETLDLLAELVVTL